MLGQQFPEGRIFQTTQLSFHWGRGNVNQVAQMEPLGAWNQQAKPAPEIGKEAAILSSAMGNSESTPQHGGLERGLGLKEAVALNMIEIVGIGPFVVSGVVIKAMGGPQALLAWLGGAVLATLDAFVWSELGAALPRAGGSYVFLREAYGPGRWGRLMSFLFVWQTFVQAPLSVASASIGFTRYAGYLHPLSAYQGKAVSGGLVIFLVLLLYRRITTIGKISLLLWVGVVGTLLWLIWGGMRHFNAQVAFDFPPGAFSISWVWFAGLGSAMVSTIYSYWGLQHLPLGRGNPGP
jgi:amino acid transporter